MLPEDPSRKRKNELVQGNSNLWIIFLIMVSRILVIRVIMMMGRVVLRVFRSKRSERFFNAFSMKSLSI